MNIVNFRLDDRLVHGVVATSWVPKFLIERVIVIDKESAEDPLLKNILRMATPKNVYLSVLTTEKAIENFKADRYGEERLMIVIKSLDVLLALVTEGIHIKKCTLGNLGNIHREHGVAITKYITLDEENKKKIDKLYQLGIELSAQLVPDDNAQDFITLMNSKWKG